MRRLKIAIFGKGAVGQPLGHVLTKAGYSIIYLDKNGYPIQRVGNGSFFNLELISIEDRGQTVVNQKTIFSKINPEHISSYDIVFISVGYINIPSVAKVIKRKLGDVKKFPFLVFLENYYEPEKLFLSAFGDYPKSKLIFGIPDIISYRIEKYRTRVLYPFCFILGNSQLVKAIKDRHFRYNKDAKTIFLQRLCSHNTAHNMLAYIGYTKGYKYINEAIADEEIKGKMLRALEEGAYGLTYKYGIEIGIQKKKIAEEVDKLCVINFSDPISRVGRTPIKKLGPFERFILPATLAYEAGVFPESLCEGIAHLLNYQDALDSESTLLTAKIKSYGVEKVLKEYAGLRKDHPITKRVKEIYRNLITTKADKRS